ncbi:zinc finger protein 587B-like, partial [Pseudophryne corroboree]|uniref:zinc finger protein 587B-like n=1 Tax=Pseudophryne corroboree TaxID=495146 RepID=UPI0030813559
MRDRCRRMRSAAPALPGRSGDRRPVVLSAALALSCLFHLDPKKSEKRLWSQAPIRRLKMNASQRAVVSFTDVAASFTEEEWDVLEEWQRSLYGNVMREIHNVLLDLEPMPALLVVPVVRVTLERPGVVGVTPERPGVVR